ncbi:50S ribosomal protein L4 [Candidatus Parcubacteria bacterium]|nr:MAG: 50S ribosomal protein L4 [Candidatus Parcubacteria bacterium]
MEAKIYNLKGEIVGNADLPEKIFGAAWNSALVHQVIRAILANRRRPWAHAKGRGEVRGGGRKPWRQKGTGRARHGSIRSPLWVGGGKAHGPTKERDYSQKINKKMQRAATLSVLSKKLKDGEVKVVKSFELEAPKTKILAGALRDFFKSSRKTKVSSALLIPGKENTQAILRAGANIPAVGILRSDSLNPYDLLSHKHVLVEEAAISLIASQYKKQS